MGKLLAICISDVRGIQKRAIERATLKSDWGIEGDAHAGPSALIDLVARKPG